MRYREAHSNNCVVFWLNNSSRKLVAKLEMSRPKPQILVEITNKETYKTEQVLASEGIWAVYYEERPINLKTSNYLVSYPGPKYKKVSFSNPGHAINLAKKLNEQFQTDKFSVVLLDRGKVIYPENGKKTKSN